MTHTFLVTVETDDSDVDAVSAQHIANEILSNLEYDMSQTGIIEVQVVSEPHMHNRHERFNEGEWPIYED